MLYAAAAVLLLSVAIYLIAGRLWGSGTPERLAYYYDLNTGELFAAAAELTAPIRAPSGAVRGTDEPAGVRAYVYTCGDQPSQYIAWLEKSSQTAQAAKNDGSAGRTHPVLLELDAGAGASSTWVALVDVESGAPIEWQPAGSQAGIGIVRGAVRACPSGLPARLVHPTARP